MLPDVLNDELHLLRLRLHRLGRHAEPERSGAPKAESSPLLPDLYCHFLDRNVTNLGYISSAFFSLKGKYKLVWIF